MPISITKLEIIALAPEFGGAALTDDQWALVIELLTAQVNVSAFGSQKRADLAARYLGAHLANGVKKSASGTGAGGGTGPLSSITVGSVSKTFRTPGAVDTVSGIGAELQSTSWGREYLRLVRMWCPHVKLA